MGSEMLNTNRDAVKQKKIEEDIAWMIEFVKERKVITLPKYSSADFIISRPENGCAIGTCLVEFRNRPDRSINDSKDVALNVGKAEKIVEAAKIMNMLPIYMVLWTEPLLMWAELKPPYPTSIITRKEQERSNDRPEEVYNIPVSSFKPYMSYWK